MQFSFRGSSIPVWGNLQSLAGVADPGYNSDPMRYQTFCGGIFETNCYLLEAPGGPILFDAPDGACDWLVGEGIIPKLLLLTHGHVRGER